MWIFPLFLHVCQKSGDKDDELQLQHCFMKRPYNVFRKDNTLHDGKVILRIHKNNLLTPLHCEN